MSNMDQQLRLFRELRLHPWVPENKVIIDAWIARLTVEDPLDATRFKASYDQKMAEYLATQPVEIPADLPIDPPSEVTVIPVEPTADAVTETVVTDIKKKSHKKKPSPTL